MRKLSCDFALIDVKRGRRSLLARSRSGERIPVIITGHIVGDYSRDDGVSIEFEIEVARAEIAK